MVAGVPLSADDVNGELARRQQGYGRGRRMQIESDAVEFLAGVRAGETIGSPIAMLIRNRDWKNWSEIMDPARNASDPENRKRAVTRPRPGHADLSGMLKYDRSDARDNLGLKTIHVSVAGSLTFTFDTTFTSAVTSTNIPFKLSVPRSVPAGTAVTVVGYATDGSGNRSPNDTLRLAVGNVVRIPSW